MDITRHSTFRVFQGEGYLSMVGLKISYFQGRLEAEKDLTQDKKKKRYEI